VFSKLANTFDPIEAARKKGDAAKAKTELKKQGLGRCRIGKSGLNDPIFN
jgi:hypothetical protein